MTMLTEAEFRAEIERLNDIIRRAAWLEQAPEEDSPYIDFESYARATEEAEVLRARAEKAEAERDQANARILVYSATLDSERARAEKAEATADRYLSAMRTLVEDADSSQDRLLIADRLAESLPGIRAIVEEEKGK